MDDGETNARSCKIRRAVKALKHTEELVRIAHIKSRAIVLHSIDAFAAFNGAADAHLWPGFLGAVFERVADEIAPDLAHNRGITRAGGQVGDFKECLRPRVGAQHFGGSLFGKGRHVDWHTRERLPSNLGEGEEPNDELIHLLAAFKYDAG